MLDGPANSGLDAMKKELEDNNLYNHLLRSLESKVQLDLYQFFSIGFCYQDNNDKRVAESDNA